MAKGGIRQLASHTLIYGLTYMAGRLLNFFLTPFYTRVITDTAEYGQITKFYAYITFLNVVFTYGMETAYFYFVNKAGNEEERRRAEGSAFYSLGGTSLLFSALMIAFAGPISVWAGFPGHAEYVHLGAAILFLDTLQAIPFSKLRLQGKALKFALLRFFSILWNIAFNLFFLLLLPRLGESGLKSLLYSPGREVYYVLLANVLSSLLTLLLMYRELLHIPRTWSKSVWQQMLTYSWPLLILGLAGMVNEALDRILLDKYLIKPPLQLTHEQALQQVGVYGAAYKLSIFMTLAVTSFRYAAEPFFFQLLSGEEDKRHIYARLLKYFCFVTGLIFLTVSLFLPLFLQILGKNYRSAGEVVPILLLANLFLGSFYYLSQWYKQTERTHYGAFVAIGGAVITLVINITFIPVYGYMASAWATLLCYGAMTVVSYLLGQRYYPVKYPLGGILWYVGSAVALYGLSASLTQLFGLGWGPVAILLNLVLLGIYLWIFVQEEKDTLPFRKIPILKKLLR
jgi:O-antigen/teichoic acid export membrane protein